MPMMPGREKISGAATVEPSHSFQRDFEPSIVEPLVLEDLVRQVALALGEVDEQPRERAGGVREDVLAEILADPHVARHLDMRHDRLEEGRLPQLRLEVEAAATLQDPQRRRPDCHHVVVV
eukprot:5427715-Prymnesium_polylepis.1